MPSQIRIIKAPEGEAPLSIRQAWIGLTLPLATTAFGARRNLRVWGVLSGPKTFLGQLLGLFQARRVEGYPVPAREALLILAQTNPSAAQWWSINAPHMANGNRMFVFNADAAEELP